MCALHKPVAEPSRELPVVKVLMRLSRQQSYGNEQRYGNNDPRVSYSRAIRDCLRKARQGSHAQRQTKRGGEICEVEHRSADKNEWRFK